jgi:hypothetical protein
MQHQKKRTPEYFSHTQQQQHKNAHYVDASTGTGNFMWIWHL